MSKAARECGWEVVDENADGALAGAKAAGPTLVVGEVGQISEWQAAGFSVVVVRDTPAAAMSVLASDNGRAALGGAARLASIQFAAASDLIEAGSTVFDGSEAVLSLPGLGQVVLERCDPVAADTWGALKIYDFLPPRLSATTSWPLEAFTYPHFALDGRLLDQGPSEIDLTGRARTLVFGPYTMLTPGVWQVKAEIMAKPDGGVLHLKFEWGSNPEFVELTSSIAKDGLYTVSIEKLWTTSGLAEFRISALQPHFHGYIDLLSVSVQFTKNALKDVFVDEVANMNDPKR